MSREIQRDKIFQTKFWLFLILIPFFSLMASELPVYKDPSQPIEARVKDLLSRMTLKEKIDQMHGIITPARAIKAGTIELLMIERYPWDTPKNTRLGIPRLRCTDGPRGVGSGHCTCFPVAMLRASTWNPELEEKVGEAMGYETRAIGANVFLAPCINLIRHPLWGRSQETYGEDPYLLGVMGSAFIRGVQKYAMACAKHFAGNSIEDTRLFVNVKMDERTLREIYLPHFKMAVDAGVASVMSAYNDLNGYLCAHNKHLLRDILKEEWGFKGFVVSDWVVAVEDTIQAINGGLDLEMPTGAHYGKKLKKAVEQGEVSEELIDQAVSRILRQKFRFGLFDEKPDFDPKKIACREHTELAQKVAEEGIVLLKNEGGILPLNPKGLKTLAIIGRLAKYPNIGDRGSSLVNPPYVITPLKAIKEKLPGSVKVLYNSGRDLSQAENIAKKADAVIVVVGYTWKDEGEGHDRKILTLHKKDEELIKRVAKANPKTIVVLEGGSAIIIESWKDLVPAILMAWYPGMEGGNALAGIIFGEVNPSGKLPIAFPESPDQLPEFDNKSKEVVYDYWHGYRLMDKKAYQPAFPFGYGLSYTTFELSDLKLSKKRIRKNEKIQIKARVKNTGKRAGAEVVQLYLGYKGSRVERAVKELKGFKKVFLEPGESKLVSFEISPEQLAYFDVEKNRWVVEEIEYLVYLGFSSKDLRLKASFKIVGE